MNTMKGPILWRGLRISLWPLLLLFILSSAYSSGAAGAEASEAVGHEAYNAEAVRIDQYSVNQGLSQNSVTGLIKDRDGFLWVATENGLNRYDGYRFESIPGPNNVFTTNYLSMLTQTEDGVIWTAIPTEGLYSLTPGATGFEKRMDAEITDDWWFAEVTDLILHRDQYYLVTETSIRRLDLAEQTGELLYEVEQQSDDYYDLLRHAYAIDEFMFIATSAGLRVLNLLTGETRAIDHLKNMDDAHIDKLNTKHIHLYQERLYVATVQGLYSFDAPGLLQSLREGAPLPQPQVNDPLQNVWQITSSQESLLLATQNGLFRYQPDATEAQPKVRFEDTDHPIFDNTVHHVLVDDQDNIWLGTPFNGLFHWHPSTRLFEVLAQGIGRYPELSSNQIWALAEDAEQRLWVGTQNGLNQLNPDGSHQLHFYTQHDSAYIHEGTVYDVFPDPQDSNLIWLYHAEFMYLFDVAAQRRIPLYELVQNEEDAELLQEYFWGYNLIGDNLWFANAEGIYAFNTQTRELAKYSGFDHPQFDIMNLYTLLGSPAGEPDKLFLGLASELWLLDTTTLELRRLYRHEPYQLYSIIYPESFVYDQQGSIWVTLIGYGLLQLDDRTLELKNTLGLNDGLPTSSIYQGHLDDSGYLWFSSMRGLLRFNPQTQHHERFTYADGASSNEFNLNASARLADGRLAFGSMRGLTLFNPAEFITNPRTLTTRISALSYISNNQRLDASLDNLSGQTFELDHDTPGVRIDVSTDSFERPYLMYYRYELEGPEPLYIERTQESSISFPRLPPGTHTLTVHAFDPRTGALADPAKLQFEVAYHPLRSPFAFILYALIAAAGLAILLHYRRRQHLKIVESKHRAERSEERLQLAIGASNSGIWDWHADRDRLYETRMSAELGYRDGEQDITMALHQSRIHRQDLDEYLKLWQELRRGERSSFSYIYRLRHADGYWLWYRDVGQVTAADRDGNVTRVTGAFQNITLERSNEEKAMLFGKAIEQTKDWVLLLNGDQLPLTANKAFCDAFGIDYSQLRDFSFMNLPTEKLHFYRDIIKELSPGEQWRSEDQVHMASGETVPVIINITAVADESIGSRAYVIVFTDIRAQKEAEAQLRQMANYDALTGLPNRALLNERIDDLVNRDEKPQGAVIFMDLDRFKQVNDSLGHSVGDKLLCIVAERVQHCLRSGDTVARLGGDEFIILLDSHSLKAVEETAQRVLSSINEPLVIDKHHIRISPSIGIALYPQHGETREELLKHADVAMYHAKDAGRNCYRIFAPDMSDKVHAKLNLEVELKQAINNGDIRNTYQPIVNAARGECVGLELLMRWQLGEKSISPDSFIPVAEDLGLIVTMTQTALRQACRDILQMRQVKPDLYVSINLSVRHLEQDDLAEQLSALISEFGLPASAIRLELTEGILIEETMRASQIMKRLRGLGFQLMLDDFGTGYSSLRYLKEFPLNIIKIDRSFTHDIGRDQSDEAIIESILAMAANLGKTCVAEGVETDAQKHWLLIRGCYLMQGFLFAEAMAPADALQWLSEQTK